MYVDVNPIWREFFANPNPAITPEFCFFVAFLKMTFVMKGLGYGGFVGAS
jgi:hypothetical protein